MKPTRAIFRVARIDHGLEQLKANLRLAGHGSASYVKAGVTGAKAEADRGTMTNAQLAVIHEFGAPEVNVPARPFIMPAFEKNRATYHGMLVTLVKASVFKGAMPFERALGIIGAKMAADMKAYVVGGPPIPPPNSPATLARKINRGKWKRGKKPALDDFGRLADPGASGAPRPLVDTGRLVGSITWAVVKKADGEKT